MRTCKSFAKLFFAEFYFRPLKFWEIVQPVTMKEQSRFFFIHRGNKNCFQSVVNCRVVLMSSNRRIADRTLCICSFDEIFFQGQRNLWSDAKTHFISFTSYCKNQFLTILDMCIVTNRYLICIVIFFCYGVLIQSWDNFKLVGIYDWRF